MREYAVAPIQHRRVALRHVGPRDQRRLHRFTPTRTTYRERTMLTYVSQPLTTVVNPV
jgi:hypothetical protein